MIKKEEPTLIIIKPDGLQKALTGNILMRLSQANLRIIGAKVTTVSKEKAEDHYRHLRQKPFFGELIRYIMGEFHTNRVICLVYYGENAVKKMRDISGATNPEEADPVSIRGSFGRITTKGVFENVVHASETVADAEREIKLWFEPDEIALADLFPSKEITVQKKLKVWA